MADIAIFVQGNTKPDITANIHDEADPTQPLDLTGCSVKFQMRQPNYKNFVINRSCTIVGSPALGNVSYAWAANDLATPGDYECQWEVTFPDTSIQTTAHPVTVTVRRR